MTQLRVHIESLNKWAADPLAGWVLPSTLIISGVLVGALISAAFMSPQAGSIGETRGPELPSIGAIIGASAKEVTPIAATVPQTAGRTPSAFGYLEFDWDPNAPGGVPGFDSWPKYEPRVADASGGR